MSQQAHWYVEHKKRFFRCPFCGRTRAAAIRRRTPAGDWGEKWWVGCEQCEDGGEEGRQYLHRLADCIGCKPSDLLHRADELLADFLISPNGRPDSQGRRFPLPLTPQIEHWASRLIGNPAVSKCVPLRYLTEDRDIALNVLVEHKVGLDTRPIKPRLTFPMFDVIGRLVAIKYREPKSGKQMLAPKGRGRFWPLYPWPAHASKQSLVICAGELDALCALSHGLDACSVTLGADYWDPIWTYAVRQRRVLICFDNNERRQAHRTWQKLATLGVSVRVVDLRKLGLTEPKADLSDFLLDGGDAQAILEGAQ